MALVRASWTSETDFWTLAAPQLIQGFGTSFFMLPLTTISLNSVPIEETASAAGIQNFVRTAAIGVATALVLTLQGNTQQAARSEPREWTFTLQKRDEAWRIVTAVAR